MNHRAGVAVSGIIGLAGAAVLTAVCWLAVRQAWLPVLLTQSTHRWALFFFLAIFSLAEIPVMTFGLNRLAAGQNPKAKILAQAANSGYVFFGAVYAAPHFLLTGQSGPGLTLAALSLARFIGTLIFWPNRQKEIGR